MKLQNWWAWLVYNLSFFIAPVQSDSCRVINIKKIILHVLLNKKPHFLGLLRGTGHKKIRNILGNLRCQNRNNLTIWLLVDVNWLFVIIKSHVKVNFKERNNNNTTTQRKIKVSHFLIIVFQWLFILLINCF